jgi:UDP-sugar diphosphatase
MTRSHACRDVIDAHDSVAIVIYHTERRCLLLVRQFRPALYAAHLRAATQAIDVANSGAVAGVNDGNGGPPGAAAVPLERGFTCELCAGIVDKSTSLEQIAAEEIEEECGYRVLPSSIVRLTAFAASVGVQGSTQTMFFARVDNSMRVSRGGGVAHDGERIELLGLPLESVEAFVMDEGMPKTSGAMFGLLWAKTHILQHEAASAAR